MRLILILLLALASTPAFGADCGLLAHTGTPRGESTVIKLCDNTDLSGATATCGTCQIGDTPRVVVFAVAVETCTTYTATVQHRVNSTGDWLDLVVISDNGYKSYGWLGGIHNELRAVLTEGTGCGNVTITADLQN